MKSSSIFLNYLEFQFVNGKEEITNECSKIYPKHNRFSPGKLVIACKHKVVYGFEILRERESATWCTVC